MKRIIAILFCFSLVLIVVGCGGDNEDSEYRAEQGARNGKISSEIRKQEVELVFIKSKAKSLYKNESGYWEADFGNGILLIYVPKGQFTMGNEKLSPEVAKETYHATPEHKVYLDHYWISKTPTTIGQFRKFVEETGYVTDVEKKGHEGPYVYDFNISAFQPKPGYYWDNAFKDVLERYPEITIDDNHPVNCVSWNDAIAYTQWLQEKIGLNFTLPTEAEWEFAARGNDGRIYPWGNEEPDGKKANYADETFDKYFPNTEQAIVHKGVNDGYAITSPVGIFKEGQSPIGALDMAGNLTEWVYDSEYMYTATEKINPIGLNDGIIKMQKAGFWAGSAGRIGVERDELVFGHNIRSDARQGDTMNSADDHLGFRIGISYVNRQMGKQ
ncbi:MAG: formylglycine-generating enzyme family protein [Firmicutes bacterium]|jgi:formylglycine-generating enzyme required for sulfatase activity|nr:formylglycine-generating enzyme family protein [Bacillota bacterium]